MATKKIIFFTAGKVPTIDEQAEIDAINAKTSAGYSLAVRNSLESASFGDNIEDSDFVAGSIPTVFNAVPDYGDGHADKPELLKVLAPASEVVEAATLQLQVVKVDGDDISEVDVTDVTASSTTYASDDELIATVDAAGLVTGVAAGTCVITATHTYASGKTVTADYGITVTAA